MLVLCHAATSAACESLLSMQKPFLNGPPSPEEFQRQVQDFLRQHFQGGNAAAFAKTESSDGQGPSERNEFKEHAFQFNYKPRDVKAYLDRFVIKQDEAKKVLSVALCDHYHHVQLSLAGKDQPNYAKQNIILIGPTGVGKTYLIRSIADLIGVPFVKADATKHSETGYVGGDVEDLVRDLVRQADGDVDRSLIWHYLHRRDRQDCRRNQCDGPRCERSRRPDKPPEADGGNRSARARACTISPVKSKP